MTTVDDHRHALRGGLAAELTLTNPIIAEREVVYETDTGGLKVGDGVTAWNDLDYWLAPNMTAAISAAVAAEATARDTAIAVETARAQAAEAAINVGLRFVVASAVATSNVASLSGTTTIDGVSLGVGSIVLLVGQTTGSQNGLWKVASGAWTRPTNYAAGNDATGMSVYVEAGSNANVGTWAVSGVGPYVIGTNATSWILLSGLGDIVLGTALSKSGTTLNVVLGTTGTTAAAGNDTRITGAAQKASNLSDLASASTARGNLGLGSLATVTPTGTPDGTKFLRDDNTWGTPSGGGGSLTSVSGSLGSDQTVGTSATTIMSTSSLATGTWLVTVTAYVNNGGAGTVDVWIGAGTATVTTPAPQGGGRTGTGTVSFTVLAVITGAGTLAIKAQTSVSGPAILALSTVASKSATGYTAVKIA